MRAATAFTQYRGGELAADPIIHIMGIFGGVVGSAILVGIAAGVADRPTFSASLVYSVGLLTMLGCSAAYNLAHNADRRGLFRRLDHAAIFLMIASTYTQLWQREALGVADRHDGDVAEGVEYRLQLGQIEPPVQGGHERDLLPGESAPLGHPN
jgi:hypothetical protein